MGGPRGSSDGHPCSSGAEGAWGRPCPERAGGGRGYTKGSSWDTPPPKFHPVGSGSRPGADALRPANPRHAAWMPWPNGREVGQGLVWGWVGGIGCSPPTPGGQGPPPGVPRCPVAPGHRPRPMWDLLQAEVNPQPAPPHAAFSHRPPEGGGGSQTPTVWGRGSGSPLREEQCVALPGERGAWVQLGVQVLT